MPSEKSWLLQARITNRQRNSEKIGFGKSALLADLFAKGENELVYIMTLNPQRARIREKDEIEKREVTRIC